jgi:hypothetical protein
VSDPRDDMLMQIHTAAVGASGDPLLNGCCSAVAQVVARIFGGSILGGEVSGNPHFWNRLPCGREVDLTAAQFSGVQDPEWKPLVAGDPVEPPELVDLLHLEFIARMLQWLRANPHPKGYS